VQPSSTETALPATEGRVEAARRRIKDGYYARPEVRRTIAELLRLRLLRLVRAAQGPPSETP
jgi:hypothetical protein